MNGLKGPSQKWLCVSIRSYHSSSVIREVTPISWSSSLGKEDAMPKYKMVSFFQNIKSFPWNLHLNLGFIFLNTLYVDIETGIGNETVGPHPPLSYRDPLLLGKSLRDKPLLSKKTRWSKCTCMLKRMHILTKYNPPVVNPG